MRIGVVFPQTEIGADPAGVRDYAQAVDDLGFTHVMAYDHVLGADASVRPGWRGYSSEDLFHEPFTLFAYLSAIVPRLELVLVLLSDTAGVPPNYENVLFRQIVPAARSSEVH
jgi:hypothetical protein